MTRLRRLMTGALILAVTMSVAPMGARAEDDKPDATAPAEVKRKVATMRLSNQLIEKPQGFKFSLFDMSSGKAPALSGLITTLNKAAKDSSINAMVIDLNSFSLSLSQAQEVGALIRNLKKAQKIVVIYASDYDTATYVLATHASFVVMPENGNILIPGVSLQMLFFRGMLDKIGVMPDFVQVGAYKGAEEPFTRKEASPEYKKQIDGLVDGMFTQIKSTIAKNRPNLSEDEIAKAIDIGWITGKQARDLKLVDFTMPRDKLNAWMEQTLGGKYEELADYGSPRKKNIDMDSPFAILQMFSPPKTIKTKDPGIAVIFADGAIMPDLPDGVQDDGYVTPSAIRKSVEKALKDEQVKSIVLRVDSPGGSASASDEIWQILKDADKKKPVTVSQGRLAASGGYYISCAGRSISADPATITGSIGVVGGKFVLKGTLDWAGINVQTVARGAHANLFSFTTPWSDEEKTFVKKTMGETYDLFKKRVKEGRGEKIKEVEAVAAGRLFTGEAALAAGLVDKLGTLNDTVLQAAKDAGIEKNYQIFIYPEPKTIADLLREGFMADVSMPASMQAALTAAPPEVRHALQQAASMMKCIQQERVLMALPGVVEAKR